MYEIQVEAAFSAGHRLPNYPGKCANVHGHNFRVQVRLTAPDLNEVGMVIDFGLVKRCLRDLTERLDHQFLNDLPAFQTVNPTTENVAKWFHDELSAGLREAMRDGVRIAEVRLWETDIQYAAYRPA